MSLNSKPSSTQTPGTYLPDGIGTQTARSTPEHVAFDDEHVGSELTPKQQSVLHTEPQEHAVAMPLVKSRAAVAFFLLGPPQIMIYYII